MPSVLSPTGTKSYAPLSDDGQGQSITATRNGAIVFSKRLPNSESASGSDRLDSLRSESEETLSPLPSDRRLNEEDGDLGNIRRASRKGKERAYDPERGYPVIEEEEVAYPPVNEEDDEERRIQENLAKFAARDMAKRRAARLSRQLPPSPDPNTLYQTASGSSSGSGSLRPLSMISESFGGVKRNSIMSTVNSVLGGKKENKWDGGLPLTETGAYQNPYDSPAPVYAPTPKITTSPAMAGSLRVGVQQASPMASPVSPTDGFTYGGPAWRGGGAAMRSQQQLEGLNRRGGEKWWHALCAWGEELDGGHGDDQSHQAGRTNPFE